MQTIKKVILVVICLVVLLTSLVSPASAVDYYFDDFGDVWLKDDDDVLYKEPYMEMGTPSILIASEPNYNFDPQQIPWLEAPSNVQDIIYSELPSLAVDEYIKVPFAVVVVFNNYVRVFVGYNLCLGRIFTYTASSNTTTRNKVRLMYFSNLGSSKYSICYSADFNHDYTVRVPWRSIEASDFGTNGNCKMFTQLNPDQNASIDFYCFGANYGKEGGVSSFTVYCNNTTDSNGNKVNYYSAHVYQNISGFDSGRFIPYPDDFPSYYFSSFTPKSVAQVEQETQKGIWDSIKELPTKIADSIKGFFESLRNYLLYFQETKPEHVNPFADILTDVKSFFDDQMSDVGDFKNSLSSTLNNVVSYIETGSGVVNTFLTAVPMLSAFITFFVVFCIVRKVIGR